MNAALVAEIVREELAVLGGCAALTALLFGGWKLWRRAREKGRTAGWVAALLMVLAAAAALYLRGRG